MVEEGNGELAFLDTLLKCNNGKILVSDKVNAPKSIDAVATALCASISELRCRHSQRQMAPQLPRSPDLSKCQVSDCH